MNIATDILSARCFPLENISLATLKDCIDDFYCKTLIRTKYIFLSKEDYEAICREADRYYHIRDDSKKDEEVLQMKQYCGVYIASLPDLPHEQEYAQVRLTFEYLEYPLPFLTKGLVMLLFEEPRYMT